MHTKETHKYQCMTKILHWVPKFLMANQIVPFISGATLLKPANWYTYPGGNSQLLVILHRYTNYCSLYPVTYMGTLDGRSVASSFAWLHTLLVHVPTK